MKRGTLSLAALAAAIIPGVAILAQQPNRPPRVGPPRVQQALQLQLQMQNRALQRGLVRQIDGEMELEDGYAFREDRETLTVLRKSEELWEQKRFAEAVEALGRLLEGGEDHFIKPEAGSTVYRSAKTEARRRLAVMPKEGADSYELQFGALARQTLDDAVARGDSEGIAEVARRFFHTRAGYEAVFLIGLQHADHGRPLAAAHVWRQLLALTDQAKADFEPLLSISTARALRDAGRLDEAKELIINARRQFADEKLQVAGAPLAWFDGDDQAIEWLNQFSGAAPRSAIPSDWTMYRGGPSRNDAGAGGPPLLAYRWRVPTANDDPAVERAVAQMHRTYEDEGLTTLPGLHPLAVGDTILMRTARNLMAIDFRTGKRLWEVPSDNPFEQLPSGGVNQAGSGANLGAGRVMYGQDSSQALYDALERRLWDDAVYGTLSSDGQLVFAVEPADSDASVYAQQSIVIGGGGRVTPMFMQNGSQTNRLAAYEISSGKLKWEIGGPKGNFPLEQAGSFFLGPPLALFGKLYVLAEADGEIRLMALENETGTLAWSQQIAVGAQEFLADQMPRQAGASPSYADGVLVCPTSAGAVVGIDLASRALLWGIDYPRQVDQWMFSQGRGQIIQMNMFPGGRDNDAQLRWYDSTVTLADGRLLLASPDSDKLTCHDLMTGAQLWEKPRGDGLYVACVDANRVIVVGANRVRALALDDGEQLWTDDRGQLPKDVRPSGRGFLSEQTYYLPTTSGEVLGIDLADGNVASAARAMAAVAGTRDERASLGNLICHRGSVISHSVEFLECFDQLKALAERTSAILAATPDDPAALMRMGEIQLQKRDYPAAIASLRRAWEINPNATSRRLLSDAYLTVLEQDFGAMRDQLAEIEQVLETPAERSAFLRLKANGLEAGGDRVAAFTVYQELANLNDVGLDEKLESVTASWQVRCERLVRGHLERLHDAAQEAGDQAAADEMERRVAEVWKKLDEGEPNREAMERFVAHFGGFAVAQSARMQLAKLRAEAGDWLSAEMILLDLEASEDQAVARQAWAQHAELLTTAARPADAAIYYERLAGEWADLACGDRTGRECFEALPAEHPVRELISDAPQFAQGIVEAIDREADFNPNTPRNYVDLDGKRGPFARSHNYFVSHSTDRSSLWAEDGLGNRLWETKLSDPEHQEVRIAVATPLLSHGRLHGHLTLISYGFNLFAVDSLGSAKQVEPHVAWRADLSESLPGVARMNGIIPAQVSQRFGPARTLATDQSQRRLGNMACLGEIGLVYQRGRTLCCVSPTTGELQWTRDDIDAGSELFGDGETLCVLAPNSQEVLLFDPVDGHELGRRPAISPDERVLTDGRCMLSWVDMGARKAELRYHDVVANHTVWQAPFDRRAKAWIVDNEAIGVFEPSGAFKLLRISDGQPLVNEQLDPEKALGDVYVIAGRDQYLLLVNELKKRLAMPVPAGMNNPIVNAHGKLYAFDRRTGKPLWDKPRGIEAQGIALRQPADLPVAVFMGQEVGGGRGNLPRNVTMLCIDKRTGRDVYQETFKSKQMPNGLQVIGSVEHGTVTIATNGKTVELKFTDVPPPPDAAGDLQARRAGPGGILFAALKALGTASRELSSPFGPEESVEFELQEGEMEFDPFEQIPVEQEIALPEFDSGIPTDEDFTEEEDPFGE
jgi:outer membrane protein assembly factor BamB